MVVVSLEPLIYPQGRQNDNSLSNKSINDLPCTGDRIDGN